MMVSPAYTFDQVEMSYLDAQVKTEAERQQEILLARNYHVGEQSVYLNDRLEEFLGLRGKRNPFRMNIVRQISNAVIERLVVSNFDTTETADASGKKMQAAWAWDVWQHNRFDATQSDVHKGAVRDGEHFVIVDWDNETRYPRWTPHQRWTDTQNGGDGDGCRLIYPNNNLYSQPLAAVKEWTETIKDNGKTISRRRRTLYYPDRIERYFYDVGAWRQYVENEGDAWPTPWVDGQNKPLGIPVIHFKNEDLRCEAWDGIPMQDALNKTLVDLIASADLTAFRIFVAQGFIPTTDGKAPADDGSNWLKIAPAQVIGTTKSAQDTSFNAIDGADPTPLSDLVDRELLWTAMITSTPTTRFITTKQVASGDTLKEQQEPMDAKVDLRQVLFGNAWEDVLSMSRKLANFYGGQALDESVRFQTLWKTRRTLDELKSKKELGIPDEQIWQEAGYTPEQIAVMKSMPEYMAKMAMMELGLNQTGG